MRNIILILCLLLPLSQVFALQLSPTSSQDVLNAASEREKLLKNSLTRVYPVRNIGPKVMGGRIVDLEINPNNHGHYLVAYASGGLFETRNAGQSFTPIFDHQYVLTIGDIAMHPKNTDLIWVGTGENNSSRSSYAGSGVFKSQDGGETWQFSGLEATQHIGRIVVHPENENIAWVASVGALYSKNEERGVFKTEDGGKSWTKTLFINDSTGVIDLVIHPKNPDVLWAAAWERSRKAWNFKESGPGSAIYKSTDGGETWKKVGLGLPEEKVGRIGLAVAQGNSDIVYAVIDNQNIMSENAEVEQTLSAKEVSVMSTAEFLALKDDEIKGFLDRYRFPDRYDVASIRGFLKKGEISVREIADYTGSANDDLFNTEIFGAEVYRSDDGGISWVKANSYPIDQTFYTYGYYFGQIFVSPKNDDLVFIQGVPFLGSDDGGKTWFRVDGGDVHVDHHALWIDPTDDKHLLLGNDGGLYETFDRGTHWTHINNVAVGQFYTVNFDLAKPYNVYGGLQDNGVFMGSSLGNETWTRVYGGDGMFVLPHPEKQGLVVTGYQFGNYAVVDMKNRKRENLSPTRDIGMKPYRFNWRTPVVMSAFNPNILYMGSNMVHKSVDLGKTWTTISPDLTKDLPQGNVPYSTLSVLEESPLHPDILWAGSDDGLIHVSTDQGATWSQVNPDLPEGLWVSSIKPSSYSKYGATLTLTGYRDDHFAPYIFTTRDAGNTWVSHSENAPFEAVNILIQDPEVPELFFLGTDHGTYVSMDSLNTWSFLSADIPNVANYDMKIHPDAHELIIGTHGRSVYACDLQPIRKITKNMKKESLMVFQQTFKQRKNSRWGQKRANWADAYEPKLEIPFFAAQAGSIQVEIKNQDGRFVRNLEMETNAGYQVLEYDMKVYEPAKRIPRKNPELSYIDEGEFQITFRKGPDEVSVTLAVE